MEVRSTKIDLLATALCAAQAEFTAVEKNSENPFFSSRYADLAAAVKMATPIVTRHGLAVSQLIGFDEKGETLTTWLLHKSGQFLCQPMRLRLVKADSQSQGSATTYARRYSYMAVLGLVADEDDDGNAAQKAQKAQKAAEAAPPAPVATPGPQATTSQDHPALKARIAEHTKALQAHPEEWVKVEAWASERELSLSDPPADKLRAVERALARKVESLAKAAGK